MPTTEKPFTKTLLERLCLAGDEPGDVMWWEGGDGAVKGFGVRVRRRRAGLA